jgi:hypothetical protein
MPTCLKQASLALANYNAVYIGAAGQFGSLNSPLTGATVLVPDSVTNVSTCFAVSISGAEYAALVASSSSGTAQTTYPAWNELGSLSIADAQVITGYVGLLWAGVWGVKQIVKMLSSSERNQDE